MLSLFIIGLLICMGCVNGKLLTVDEHNFDDVLHPHPLVLVLYIRTHPNHDAEYKACTNIKAQVEIAAEQLAISKPPVPVAVVDTTRSNALQIRHGISTFPALKLFRRGDEVYRKFRGGNTADTIVPYIKKYLSPPSTEINSVEEVSKFIPHPESTRGMGNVSVIIAFSKHGHEQDYDLKKLILAEEELLDVPEKLIPLKFLHTSSEAVMKHFGEKFRQTFAIYNGLLRREDTPVIWDNQRPVVQYQALNFLQQHARPLVSRLTEQTESFLKRPDSLMFYFFSPIADENTEEVKSSKSAAVPAKKLREALHPLASLFRNVTFVLADPSEHEREMLSLGYDRKMCSYPRTCYGMFRQGTDLKYRHRTIPTAKSIADSAGDLLHRYFSGSLFPYLRSQGEFSPQELGKALPVVLVTGTTFGDIVLDVNKDVLLLLHSPSCGHCEALYPLWQHLANEVSSDPMFRSVRPLPPLPKFKEPRKRPAKTIEANYLPAGYDEDVVLTEMREARKKLEDDWHLQSKTPRTDVVVAMMDAKLNEAPKQFPIPEYPTIYFAAATSQGKLTPKHYTGERTVAAFRKWILENAETIKKKGTKNDSSVDEL